jgi:predicted amidophosphoribosyltransferase
VIVCRQCGQSAREGEDFCESCGAFLEWEGEKVDPAPTSTPAPGTGTAPAPGPAPPRHGEPVPEPDRWVTPEPSPGPDVPGGAMPPPSGPAPSLQTREAGQGTTGSDVTCLECGGRNAADRRFCRRCGASLELVALARPSVASPVEPPPVPGPAAAGGPLARAPGSAVPDAPRVVARGPAVPEAPKVVPRAPAAPATRPGAQPAEQQARPPAVRPEARPAAVEPGGALCSQCGTANPPGRRFCRKCGAALTVAGKELEPGLVAAPRPSFWQRLKGRFRRGGGKEDEAQPTRTARAAYRRTLDVRYRVYRVLAVLGGAALLAGSFGLTGYNPITGVRGLWDRFFPRYEQVDQLQAVVDPDTVEDPELRGRSAVDGDPGTEWAAVWLLAPDADPVEECLGQDSRGGGDQALVITLPEPTKIKKVSLQGGLPAGDVERPFQWSPTLVELQYDNGECDQVSLDTTPGFQDHRLSSPETTTVRVTILDAAPPKDPADPGNENKVGLGEVRIFKAR